MERRIAEIYDFSWIIKRKLAASEHPGKVATILGDWRPVISWLFEQGIGGIITLTPEWPLDGEVKKILREYEIEWYFLPIQDFRAPETFDTAFTFVKYVKEINDKGKAALVHCHAGCGRTGTMLIAYLMIEKGYTLEDAQKELRYKRYCIASVLSNEDQYGYLIRLETELLLEKQNRRIL